jgi:hypothetical protein
MAFWLRVVAKRGLEHAVKVKKNGETVVEIADELPYLPFLKKRGRPRFVITTEGYLLTEHFGNSKTIGGELTAKGQINRNRHKSRGRTAFLTLVDSYGNEEEMVGVCFHVDDKKAAPVMLRSVALRTDSIEKRDLSRACAAWLLAYLVEASRQARDKEEVGADEGRLSDPALIASLGFRPAQAPPDIQLIGRYLAFHPPFSTKGRSGS